MDKRERALRKNKLLDAMKLTSRISTEEAMDILGVSKSTVVRLFIELENDGSITRIQNGAVLERTNFEFTYDDLEFVHFDEKKQIGERAVQLVSSGDTIYLDSGTTLPHMCTALAEKIQSGELSGVKIIIRSLINLNIFHKLPNVHCIGGEYRHSQRDFNGYLSEEAVRQLHFDKCFLGTDGLDFDFGITTSDFSSARLNKIVFERSFEKYILTDSSKFKKTASIKYADITSVTGIVTDGVSPEFIRELEENRVKYYI